MKNRITIIYCLLFSILIHSQTVEDKNESDEVKNSETISRQSSSSNDGSTSYTPTSYEPISIIDNLSSGSINKSNAKMVYKVPITELTTNRLTVGVNLSFNGANAIKHVDYSNKKNDTGIAGLGWSINTSKIISDNKQTGYRDDDEFFLLEGGLKKLVCTKKTSADLYEFKVENLPNWNVFYYRNNNYWLIIKDNGDSYFYGDSDTSVSTNANENIIRWKNWIGDTRATGGTLQSYAWNLSKISNQWDDNIQFFYETTDQAVQADNLGPKHTEASYLVKIETNSGESVELNYSNKLNTSNIQEFYEPHTEVNEPDAYQERYEDKFLDNIILKRSDGQQLTKHQLDYEIYGANLLSKRYLTKVTTYNSSNESLNPQRFEYNITGEFKGTIYKIKNTNGSEVIYQYENKFLFKNEPIKLNESGVEILSPYFLVNDEYFVQIDRSIEEKRYAIVSNWKNGTIESEKIYFENYQVEGRTYYKEFIGDNFFGFVHNNVVQIMYRGSDKISWKKVKFTLPYQYARYDWPKRIKLVNKNNYILVVTASDTYPIVFNGSEMVLYPTIDGLPYRSYANFLMEGHHLWISRAPIYNTTPADGYFEQHFISYRLDQTFNHEIKSNLNPNFTIYNSNIIFTYLDKEQEIDLSEITLNNLHFAPKFYHNSIYYSDSSQNTWFFTGNQWIKSPINSSKIFGNNKLHNQHNDYNGEGIADQIHFFNPNSNTFTPVENFNRSQRRFRYQYFEVGEYSINNTSIFKNTSNSQIFVENYDSETYNNQNNSDSGRDDIQFFTSNTSRDKLIAVNTKTFTFRYFYIDKENELKKREHNLSQHNDFYDYKYHLSDKYFIESIKDQEVLFYKIFENKIEQDIYDIVVKSIDVYDGIDTHTITEFNYNNFKTLSDGSTYYGEVITEKKGDGNSSLGKVFNYYNMGGLDIRKLGILERTVIKDTEGKTVQESLTEMSAGSDLFENNSENKPVFIGNRLLQNKKINHSYFYKNSLPNPNIFTSQEEYEYNEKGLINKTKKNNSKGLLEEQLIEYAYENSSAFENTNMLNAVSKRTSMIDNEKVWVSLAEWTNENSKLYPNKDFGGPSEADLRLTSEITKISNKGVVEETTNGKGFYAVNLSGHNYKRSVASIDNIRFSEVINNLDVSYSQLQNLNNSQLRIELMKLYNRLPNAMIKLSFYDDNGNIISEIDARQEEVKYHYDSFNRLEYITDSNNKVLKKNIYNYKTE